MLPQTKKKRENLIKNNISEPVIWTIVLRLTYQTLVFFLFLKKISSALLNKSNVLRKITIHSFCVDE